MKKTLMAHGFAFAGMAAMVTGLVAAGAPEAESRTKNTTYETRTTTTKTVSPTGYTGPSANLGATNENSIEPAGGPESNSPATKNTYESTYQRQNIQENRY